MRDRVLPHTWRDALHVGEVMQRFIAAGAIVLGRLTFGAEPPAPHSPVSWPSLVCRQCSHHLVAEEETVKARHRP